MRNSIIYILLVFLTTFASVSASYREYIFKMPPSAVKMFSSEPLRTLLVLIKLQSLTTQVNYYA